eukprot:TRINITY_DN1858_c0_g1_i1.p1 TRINITY_DN1858_c0_g1~~TRINITY_DN1858_c0_g1_i1.p1  ORF type:complete len:1305 (-),score=506.54 TRINITY_DN1858_c0_g1_i1:1043-4957(-)
MSLEEKEEFIDLRSSTGSDKSSKRSGKVKTKKTSRASHLNIDMSELMLDGDEGELFVEERKSRKAKEEAGLPDESLEEEEDSLKEKKRSSGFLRSSRSPRGTRNSTREEEAPPSPTVPPRKTSSARNDFLKRSSMSGSTNPKQNVGNEEGAKANPVENRIYSRILLRIDPTAIVLQPLSVEEGRPLVINRINYELHDPITGGPLPFQTADPAAIVANSSVDIIFGILGIIPLLSGNHLIVVSAREKVGQIFGRDIYKVTGTRIVAIPIDDSQLSEDEKKEEKVYLALLNSFLEGGNFYFSYNYDVTHSLQRIAEFSEEQLNNPLWKRVDERFFWNRFIQSDLIEKDLSEWILPVMDGLISLNSCLIGTEEIGYHLISRRSCHRTGARYHTRGADPSGHSANFVETEQILINRGNASSFVQIRGSIPTIWHQKSKVYRPKPVPEHSPFTRLALRNHFSELFSLYGNVVAVSLIDKNGLEADLGDNYETQVKLFDEERLRYVAFDFHNRCRNNNYKPLQNLLEEVSPDLDKAIYHLQDNDGKQILRQTGIIRTNCVDCLDRTNVVQSVFAKYQLKTQFAHLGVATDGEDAQETFAKFYSLFQNVWADNADTMSEQYTGAAALKTDFTRTGRRSVKGLAADGYNSMKRYLSKTLQWDDARQASTDIFLGKFRVGKMQFVENEGVHRFDVQQIKEVVAVESKDQLGDEEDRILTLLEINVKAQTITEYTIESGERSTFSFSSLRQMEKSHTHFHLLRLLFDSSSSRHCYIFKGTNHRQLFYDLVLSNCAVQSPPRHLKRSLSKESIHLDPTKIFYGSWNMRYVNSVPTQELLRSWVPEKGDDEQYDVVAIGVQNCKYPVPPEFQSIHTSSHHFFYLIQKFFGDKYECIGTVSTNTGKSSESSSQASVSSSATSSGVNLKEEDSNLSSSPSSSSKILEENFQESKTRTTDLIVLVRSQTFWKVTNVGTTKAFYKENRKADLVGPSFWKVAKSKVIGSSKERSTTASGAAPKDNSNVIGGAIYLDVFDSSICFVNVLQFPGYSEDNVMLLKGTHNKIYSDFQHVFLTGFMNPAAVPVEKYLNIFSLELPAVPLRKRRSEQSPPELERSSASTPNVEEGLVGGTYWRSRSPTGDFLGQIQIGLAKEDLSSCSLPGGHSPFFTEFHVNALKPPSCLGINKAFIIEISDLKVTDMLSSVQGKVDTALVISSPLILQNVRTSFSRKASWTDKHERSTYFCEEGYLSRNYFKVEVYNKDLLTDEWLYGIALIPLKDSFDDNPIQFKSEIIAEDEFVGKLTGSIRARLITTKKNTK